jgi:hypothetical protein
MLVNRFSPKMAFGQFIMVFQQKRLFPKNGVWTVNNGFPAKCCKNCKEIVVAGKSD